MATANTTPNENNLATSGREVEIVHPNDPVKHAASLKDTELLEHLQKSFRTIRDSSPYLREARDRFAAPGRRLPVPGRPTWSQWVQANLHVNIRTVQRWLAAPGESRNASKTKSPRVAKPVRPVETLQDWPAAMRRVNDLLTAVARLKAHSPVGTDLLVQPLKELELLVKAERHTSGVSVLARAASRVRGLAAEFIAIKQQFDEDNQFYLDQLLANLICGDAEPEPPTTK